MRSLSRLAPSLLIPVLLACNGPAPATTAAATAAVTPQPALTATPGPGVAAPASAEADKHYQTALELEAAGRHVESRAEVDLAIAGGAGRDAKLLAAKLAIMRDDLDAARRLLEPLATEKDALVLYNLGLIAQRTGQYNEARTRYLAALKADPNYAAIRYNLAVLTWDAGVKDEAQHHARKFLELSPGDPNGAELRRKVELDGAPTPAPDPTTPDPAALNRPPGTAGDPSRRQDSGLKNPF